MNRPAIPDPIKREVRQRCGFGCVVCGIPIYEYDHMTPYAETQAHEADNLTLLCPTHHREKTNGLLTVEAVRSANGSPHNPAQGISRPYGLHFGGTTDATMNIGGEQIFCEPPLTPIVIDNFAPFVFDIGPEGLSLWVQFLDRRNRPALTIVANELVYSTGNWDVEFTGHTLTLREGPGQIALRLTLNPPNAITLDRASLRCNGVQVDIDADDVSIGGRQFRLSHNWWRGVPVIMTVGFCPSFPRPPLPWLVVDVDRYERQQVEPPEAAPASP